ncbi:MAG: glutaminyl-peptide cyclotransferase [Nitrospirota bacterium]
MLAVGVVGAAFVLWFQTGTRQAPGPSRTAESPRYGYEVVKVYPHDPTAFTQGLLYRDGFLFESTGLNGQSSLRKVRLETGEVLQRRPVAEEHFAEGLADWGNQLIQLTWQSRVGFRYDLDTFVPQGTVAYPGEGWGLTHDRSRLIMSDGTADLRFFDPVTFDETGRVTVTDNGQPVGKLNELEFVNGEIYANVWRSDDIVIIAPQSGLVTGRVDLRGLLPAADRTAAVDVLNGIAYDAEHNRLFVTGKYWPKLFEIRLRR